MLRSQNDTAIATPILKIAIRSTIYLTISLLSVYRAKLRRKVYWYLQGKMV